MNELLVSSDAFIYPKEVLERTKKDVIDSTAINTQRAYKSDWKLFEEWCAGKGIKALPATAELVCWYLDYLVDSGYKSATITRKITSIGERHRYANERMPNESVAVKKKLQGIRKKIGVAQMRKTPLMLADLRQMIEVIPQDLRGLRDKAILLTGWYLGARRSEILDLNVEDIEFKPEGLIISLKKSKTNQEGLLDRKAICYTNSLHCPVKKLQEWLQGAKISSGAVFRQIDRNKNINDRLSDKHVVKLVKKYVEKIGLDPSLYGGHSLRAGLATECARQGLHERDIMRQTGHKSVDMVRRYIREGSIFIDNVTSKLTI